LDICLDTMIVTLKYKLSYTNQRQSEAMSSPSAHNKQTDTTLYTYSESRNKSSTKSHMKEELSSDTLREVPLRGNQDYVIITRTQMKSTFRWSKLRHHHPHSNEVDI